MPLEELFSAMADPWVALFSGGKDSSWALHLALEAGRSIERLVTVHPPAESYLYHVPATELAGLAAESIGVPLVVVEPDGIEAAPGADAATQGDAELVPLERALGEIREDCGGLGGVVTGAVASEFQRSRLDAMCDRLDAELFAPLWGRPPSEILHSMVSGGLESRVVAVAARGLDRQWLGRPLDRDAIADLEDLHERFGVHPLGEGGEYESLVVAGPHMDRRIEFEAATEWDGTRGRLDISEAWLV